MPIPDRARLFAMADLHCQGYAVDAATRLESMLVGDADVIEIVRTLVREITETPLFLENGLKRRITLMLAIDTLLAFAPDAAKFLEETEALDDVCDILKH